MGSPPGKLAGTIETTLCAAIGQSAVSQLRALAVECRPHTQLRKPRIEGDKVVVVSKFRKTIETNEG